MIISDKITLLLYLILQAVVSGTISAIVGRTITNYEGPLNLFPRLKRLFLPPMGRDVLTPDWPTDIDYLIENLSEFQADIQDYLGEIQAWELYFQEDPDFKKTIQGTMYGILDCVFCIGPYLTCIIALLMSAYFGNDPVAFSIVWLGSYSIHYLINKKLEA